MRLDFEFQSIERLDLVNLWIVSFTLLHLEITL